MIDKIDKFFIQTTLGAIISAALLLTACSKTNMPDQASAEKQITIAFAPGYYYEQFVKAIAPQLDAKGYTITAKQFSHGQQINPALVAGSLQVSVHQTRAYMESYNLNHNSNMITLVDTASGPESLRSKKHRSLAEVADGMTVAIPNDPVNAERAVRVLEELGWVKIQPDATPLTFGLHDVIPDKYNLNIIEIDAAQALRALDDVDFAIVYGSHVVAAGQRIADSLKVENCPLRHRVMVSILAENRDTQWAKDLKEAYESKQFADYIKSNPAMYAGFNLPVAWDKFN